MRRAIKIIYISLLLLILIGIDFFIGKVENKLLENLAIEKRTLEYVAYYKFFIDIYSVEHLYDGVYKITIKIDSIYDEPIYITYPQIKAYVQVKSLGSGSWWSDAVVKDVVQNNFQFLRISYGSHYIEKTLIIPKNNNYQEELFPYYFHVKLHIFLLLLPERFIKKETLFKDVFARHSDLFLYIKDWRVKDEDIIKKISFADNRPPTFFPVNWYSPFYESIKPK